MGEITRIRHLLRRSFDGGAWHGPALREVLADVDWQTAAAKPSGDAHSIWEIVVHIAAWEDVVLNRLGSQLVEDPPPEQDWPVVVERSEEAWRQALSMLQRNHLLLQEAIGRLNESKLDETVPGKEHTVYEMLHGVIEHDDYHAGQIALLKRTIGDSQQ